MSPAVLVNPIITQGFASEEPGVITKGFGAVVAPTPPTPPYPPPYIKSERRGGPPMDDGGYIPRIYDGFVPTGTVVADYYPNPDYSSISGVPRVDYNIDWSQAGYMSNLIDELKDELRLERKGRERLIRENERLISRLSGDRLRLSKENDRLLSKIKFFNDMRDTVQGGRYIGGQGILSGLFADNRYDIGQGFADSLSGFGEFGGATEEPLLDISDVISRFGRTGQRQKLRSKKGAYTGTGTGHGAIPLIAGMGLLAVLGMDTKIKNKKRRRVLMIILLGIAAVIGIYLFYRWRKRKKAEANKDADD